MPRKAVTMQRRHFQLIADVFLAQLSYHRAIGTLSAAADVEVLERLAHAAADRLRQTNSHFDRTRFLVACGVRTV